MSKFQVATSSLQNLQTIITPSSLPTKIFKRTKVITSLKKIQKEHTSNKQGNYVPKIQEGAPIIPLGECKRFMRECLEAVGTPRQFAKTHSEVLAEADIRGHYSRGLRSLEMYIGEIVASICDPSATPAIIQESTSTAWVDARNGLGSTSGNFCMKLAIKKAKETGVGWVVSKNSNHNGISAWYVLQALRSGMLGISLTNNSPTLAPTRSCIAALGTNPISFGAPGLNEEYFLLDTATSAVTVGKLEIAKRLSKPLPKNWALDENGQITTDPETGLKALRLLPLGGSEASSGYKGSGLAMMVEILTGITSGSNYSTRIKNWWTFDDRANLGQCYIAIDIKRFGDGFQKRLSDLLNIIRNLPPQNPKKPVLAPGDIELANIKRQKKQGGIRYSTKEMVKCERLAKRLHVEPLMGERSTYTNSKYRIPIGKNNTFF